MSTFRPGPTAGPRRPRRGPVQTLTTGLFCLLIAGNAAATGQVGESAADFTLNASTGESHTLSDHQGEVVLLFMMGYA